MYFQEQKAILIHVPKTGGNSLQSKLLPHSSDYMVVHKHQDGTERFNIEGKVTPRKHATLQEYFEILGEEIFNHKIIITARDPVARAVSIYFSPSSNFQIPLKARGLRKLAKLMDVNIHIDQKEWEHVEPEFHLEKFKQMAMKGLTICDFLRVNGDMVRPNLVIRQEQLALDFKKLLPLLGLPNSMSIDEQHNVSKTPRPKIDEAINNPEVKNLCYEIFAEDYELLDNYT